MFTEKNLNGTIIKSYIACKKQGWLASRKLTPSLQNHYIQMGTAYSNIRNNVKKLSEIKTINNMTYNYRFVILKEINKIKKYIVEATEYQGYVE